MQTPVPDYLEEVLDACREPDEGELATYIPELARVDRDLLAVAMVMADGTMYCAGDCEAILSIQSISKAFVYALALEQRGIDELETYVDTEPSGDAFNQISLEPGSGRPRNPMINIGALTTHGLIGAPRLSSEERFELVLAGLSGFAGRELSFDEEIFESEWESADRNRALAFLARSHGKIEGDPLEVVRGYTRQCAIQVTTADLAMMGATLANGGINPLTGDRVVGLRVVRQVLSVMTTCGMYDAAGDWVSSVGIPAKSGVSGGILGALPGQVGIGVFSPPLDRFGNSVRGVRVCERLSEDMGLHLMSGAPLGPITIRDVRRHDGATLVELQGAVHFSEGERVLRRLAELRTAQDDVIVSVSRVAALDDTGRRMMLEGIRRLSLDGHRVTLIDPDHVLADLDPDLAVRRVGSLDEATA